MVGPPRGWEQGSGATGRGVVQGSEGTWGRGAGGHRGMEPGGVRKDVGVLGAPKGLESLLSGAWTKAGGTEVVPQGDAGPHSVPTWMPPGPWAGSAPHCRLDVSARVPRSGLWKVGHPGASLQDRGAVNTLILCPDP